VQTRPQARTCCARIGGERACQKSLRSRRAYSSTDDQPDRLRRWRGRPRARGSSSSRRRTSPRIRRTAGRATSPPGRKPRASTRSSQSSLRSGPARPARRDRMSTASPGGRRERARLGHDLPRCFCTGRTGAGAAPPQARADQPRAARLGPGRRGWAGRGRRDRRVGGLICWENLMPLARFPCTRAASRSTSRRPRTTPRGLARLAHTSPASARFRPRVVFQRASSYRTTSSCGGRRARRPRRLGDPAPTAPTWQARRGVRASYRRARSAA
jgi:hypothetical protein